MNKPDFRLIGKPIPRAEDGRLITGKGRFTDDFQFDGQTYAAMVRSPYPHARIVSIDSRPSDALALALRVDCPIYVEDEVLKNSKLAANVSDRVSSEELRKWLEGLNDEDLGRYKM